MASLKQAEAAIQGAQVPGKPVWLGLTVDDQNGTELRSGESLSDAIALAQRYQVDSVLINCSVPEAVNQAMEVFQSCELPFGAYANGFTHIAESFKEAGATVDALSKRVDLSPEVYADFVESWVERGAQVVGGCCEIGPAHIQELASRFSKQI